MLLFLSLCSSSIVFAFHLTASSRTLSLHSGSQIYRLSFSHRLAVSHHTRFSRVEIRNVKSHARSIQRERNAREKNRILIIHDKRPETRSKRKHFSHSINISTSEASVRQQLKSFAVGQRHTLSRTLNGLPWIQKCVCTIFRILILASCVCRRAVVFFIVFAHFTHWSLSQPNIKARGKFHCNFVSAVYHRFASDSHTTHRYCGLLFCMCEAFIVGKQCNRRNWQ